MNDSINDLKRRAGITEDEDFQMPEDRIVTGIRLALQNLNAGRPDSAKYYLEAMLKYIHRRR